MTSPSKLQPYVDVFKGDVSYAWFTSWLTQFELEDQSVVLRLVSAFKYYSLSDTFRLLDSLFAKLQSEHGVLPEKTWFVPCGYVAKSGDAIAYFFKKRNALPDEAFVRASDLTSARLLERPTVVFIDDFVGSGQLVGRTITELVRPMKQNVPSARFVFATLVGMKRGLARFATQSDLGICAAEYVGYEAEAFSHESELFPVAEDRLLAERVVRKYTERLSPKSPLGYGASQALLGFFFGTPNNTLPIFWRKSDEWRPLLPHGDALHDPRRLIDVPRGFPVAESAPFGKSSDEGFESASRTVTAALFETFQELQNMRSAARLLSRLQLADDVVIDFLRAIEHLADRHHEKHPLATGLLLAPSQQATALAANCFLVFDPPFALRDLSALTSAANLIDGVTGALLVDPRGRVLGARMHSGSRGRPEALVPTMHWSAASSSADTDGALAIFAGGGRVSLYDRDVRILARRDGKWHVAGVPKALHSLDAEHGLVPGLVEHALRAAMTLAEAGHGAMLVLGDESRIDKLIGRGAPTAYRWVNIDLSEPLLHTVVHAARQDGAALFDTAGKLRTAMAILRPPPEATGLDEERAGARHTTGVQISSVSGALVLVVSEEGPITIYSKGTRVLRMMG